MTPSPAPYCFTRNDTILPRTTDAMLPPELLPRSVPCLYVRVRTMRAPHCVRECMQVQMVSAMSFHFVFVAYCLPSLLQVPLVFLWRNRAAKSNRSKILGNLSSLTTVGSRQKPYRGWVQARGMISSSSESWNMHVR